VSVDVTFFEFVPYFPPQVPVTTTGIVPPLSMSLLAPASTNSSPVSPVDTSEHTASKPIQDFRYVYTHRQKVPIAESVWANPSSRWSSIMSISL